VRRKILRWVVLPGIIVGVVLAGLTAFLLRPARLKTMVTEKLSTHLNLDVTLDDIAVSLLPRPNVVGTGLRMRVRNRPDLPPFISIDRFSVGVGLRSAIRQHVGTVHADGLKIAVPPREVRDEMRDQNRSDGPDDGQPSAMAKIIVDELVAHDAELLFVRRDKSKKPLLFKIHDLTVNAVGFNSPMPYKAKLTNPVPTGLVEATGSVGPWRPEDPTATPLDGEYKFSNADLSTINGIGGILQSTGTFEGELTEIRAIGEAAVPDFSLDLGGRPVPLTAKFRTLIDGTNGSVKLEHVDAVLQSTHIVVTGAIENLEGPGRHDVKLKASITDGRIEDVLMLAIDSPKPVMTGDITLMTSVDLPPGPTRVRQRIALTGKFGLEDATFTDAQVQGKMKEISRRSQGKDEDDPLGRVMTDLRGRFTLKSSVLTLPDLKFQVPGADVALAGNYSLASETMDFRGTLRMKATISKAVGGFKSIFLIPFNPLFRKDGAGAVLPIKITGPRKEPKFGLEMGKVFKGP
jgi:hypothetical protein